jgi:hypothetical protein
VVTWNALRGVALDGTDAGWFPSLAPIVVDRARRSKLGRRLLARRLATSGAPILFGTLPRTTPQPIAVSAWTTWPAERIRDIALDLGALALAPALRSVVGRDDVLRIRGVLGEERYALALASAALAPPGDERPHTLLARSLGSDEAFDAAVRQRGFGELIAFAHAVHPACAERVLLCEAPGRIAEARVPWLDGARVATHLAALPAANDGGADDGDSRNH